MNIQKWVGLLTAASPYALPAGATVRQHNVQIKKIGQLVPRPGLSQVYQNSAGAVLGAYRIAGGPLGADSMMLFRRNEAIGTSGYRLEKMAYSDATSSYASTTLFQTETAPDFRPSFCQDRYGNCYTFFGSGITPQVLRLGATSTVDCGMPAPTVAPTITPQGDGFFIERVDVINTGTSYYKPPSLTVVGGNPARNASLRAVVKGGQIVAVDVEDGGSNFTGLPQIVVSNEQVGQGFLGRGVIASSTATYGFPSTLAPSITGSYTTNYTVAASNTESLSATRIAYRRPLDTTDQYAVASFSATANVPVYTVVIPLGPSANPVTRTASISPSSNQITFDSLTGLAVGNELVIDSEYFDTNPVITTIPGSGTTVTVDRLSKNTFYTTATNVSVSVVGGSGAYATFTFTSISGAWRLGATNSPGYAPTSAVLRQTTGIGAYASTNYNYQTVQNNWYGNSTNKYWENLTDLPAAFTNLAYTLNDDYFWGLMPSSTLGYIFANFGSVSTTTLSASTYKNSYFPTYERVGYRMLTGRDADSGTEAQWSLLESSVQLAGTNQPYIDITLTPMKKDDGTAYTTYANTRHPTVRVYLSYCPESWTVQNVNAGTATGASAYYTTSTSWDFQFVPYMGMYRRLNFTDSDPTVATAPANQLRKSTVSGWLYWNSTGSSQANVVTNSYSGLNSATRWWAAGYAWHGSLPRPVHGFRPSAGTTYNDGLSEIGLAAGTVQVIDPGQYLEKGTRYRLRFEQYNAIDRVQNQTYNPGTAPTLAQILNYQSASYNTTNPTLMPKYLAKTVSTMTRRGAFGSGYTDFVFEATDLDTGSVGSLQLLPGPRSGVPTVSVSGSKWANGQTVSATLRQINPNSPGASTAAETFTYTAQTLLPAVTTQRIGDVTILSGGTQYFKAPTILSRDGGGYGLRVACTVNNGAITYVQILEGGDGYTSSPTLYTSVEPATLYPVMRGTLQGTYRCAYRFADYSQTVVATPLLRTTIGSQNATLAVANPAIQPGMQITGHSGITHMTAILSVNGTAVTLAAPASATVASIDGGCTVRDMTLPIAYSDFSPIVDVEADVNGSGRASQFNWSVSGVTPPKRADFVEFFRTSSDQSLVFYRVDIYGTVNSATGVISIAGNADSLSDEELFDTDRANYAALPVVLPNGNLNAYRFGVPRNDMAVAVAYQDRLWYAVSTSGSDPNTVFYSEYDEFESCPDQNELPIQNNLRTTDYLTALVPFGSLLLAMQTLHCYAITYNTDPGTDASIQLVAHRGSLCHHTWDVFDDVLYVADERGIYSMTRSGNVENLSDAVRNVFDEGGLNLKYRNNFFVKINQIEGVLRFFYVPSGVVSETPTKALCYHIQNKVWWTEGWPNSFACSTDYRTDAGLLVPHYGSMDGGIYNFSGTRDYAYRDIASVSITNGGSGYVTPPAVRVTSGFRGAQNLSIDNPANDFDGVSVPRFYTAGTLNGNGAGAVLQAIIKDGSVVDIIIVESGYGYGIQSPITGAFSGAVTIAIDPPPSGTTATATATARSPNNRATVPWQVRTGPMALITDSKDKRLDGEIDRSVSVTYKPTSASKTLNLREYYNNAPYPRSNVMRRDRGTGWVHETTMARTTLDMIDTRSSLGVSTGQAKAQFAGRSMSEMGSADRHLAIELSCDAVQNNDATDPPEALIYSMEVSGVADGS